MLSFFTELQATELPGELHRALHRHHDAHHQQVCAAGSKDAGRGRVQVMEQQRRGRQDVENEILPVPKSGAPLLLAKRGDSVRARNHTETFIIVE